MPADAVGPETHGMHHSKNWRGSQAFCGKHYCEAGCCQVASTFAIGFAKSLLVLASLIVLKQILQARSTSCV